MNKLLICLLTLLAISFTASAEIYRWVDAQGRVHYSDRPVPGATRVKSVDSRPTNPDAIAERKAADEERRAIEQAEARQQQTTRAAEKGVEQDMAKLQAERCKKAQEQYRIATESQRLYRVGKDGEREYLTDEEISTARLNARKTLDEACGKKSG